MAGIRFDTTTGQLTINSVNMHCAAWCMLDLLELWGFNVATRGANVLIPGTAGQTANPLRITESQHTLEMVITGDVDRFGVVASNPTTQLQTNIDYLRTNVITPPSPPTATRAASLLMPSGATRTANIQVLGLDLDASKHLVPHEIGAFLHIAIPSGVFA